MKQFKNRLAALVYKWIFLIVKIIPVTPKENRALIVKTDEIGDYILFRNYFRTFKESRELGTNKILMVGNKAWKALYDEFDKGVIDDVIWLDKLRFKKNLVYRFRILKEIRALGASLVINCIFSRTTLFDDGIVNVATGFRKIAMKSDKTNRVPGERDLDSVIYSEVIDAGDERIFDTIRNRNFVQQILGLTDLSIETKIPVPQTDKTPHQPYFAMFLGAGNSERRWPIASFVATAKYAYDKYGLAPLLCGGPGDEEDAILFEQKYNGFVLNFAGKTALVELVSIIGNAKFLLCVDTGALHIAAAVGTPVVGLFSGKFFQRFAPYPKEITNQFFPVYPDFVDEMIAANNPDLFDTYIMRNDTMKLIPPEKVFPFIDQIMSV